MAKFKPYDLITREHTRGLVVAVYLYPERRLSGGFVAIMIKPFITRWVGSEANWERLDVS